MLYIHYVIVFVCLLYESVVIFIYVLYKNKCIQYESKVWTYLTFYLTEKMYVKTNFLTNFCLLLYLKLISFIFFEAQFSCLHEKYKISLSI